MLISFAKTFLLIFLAEMGDKSQLFMVAMTAEYRLRHIFCGVIAAILSLNLLAIAVGSLLGDFLPMTLISLIAGTAFLLFALFGLQEEEEEKEQKRRKGAIIAIFGAYFLAELGDKTQLAALTLAASEGAGDFSQTAGVFLGACCALFGADLIGLLLGFILEKKIPTGVFRWISFLVFVACGAVRLLEGFSGLFSVAPRGNLISGFCTSGVMVIYVVIVFLMVTRGERKLRNGTEGHESVSVQ